MADVGPLALDVDGTFLKTDLLLECLLAALGRHPGKVAVIVARRVWHPGEMKAEIAAIADLRTDLLPVRPELARLAAECRAAGRDVVLVSSADAGLVRQLAADHGLSPKVFGSEDGLDLRGERKAAALLASYGAGGFDYAGDSAADWAIWRHAENTLMIGRHPRVERRLVQLGKNVAHYRDPWRTGRLIAAMRPRHWIKSLYAVIPLIAAHQAVSDVAAPLVLGLLALTLASAGLYLIGDLMDLEADRRHPLHRTRAFASGAVPPGVGLLASLVLLITAFAVAGLQGAALTGGLALFCGLSLAYTLRLKHLRWIDIAAKAALDLARVLVGSLATGVALTGHTLIFLFAVFLTLACLSRRAALAQLPRSRRTAPPGRAYSPRDKGDLTNMAALGAFGAVLIFLLYALSDQAHALYPFGWVIWVAALPFAGWLARLVRAADRDRLRTDPLLYALRDPGGLLLLALTGCLLYVAAGGLVPAVV